ncbi:MAG: HPr-rel-A system PqqD family peptide chaperone [Alphaproteobacteria bacterium]|nr:HPr-rel-A system PqqD family peptide chaperone [Alphaproteobacteria bacterium]
MNISKTVTVSANPNNDHWLWGVYTNHMVTHSFGDTTFVYNRQSGTTHIFNLVSMAMIEFLSEKPRSMNEIIRDFPAYMGVDAAECPAGVVRRLFGELDEIGLLELVQS